MANLYYGSIRCIQIYSKNLWENSNECIWPFASKVIPPMKTEYTDTKMVTLLSNNCYQGSVITVLRQESNITYSKSVIERTRNTRQNDRVKMSSEKVFKSPLKKKEVLKFDQVNTCDQKRERRIWRNSRHEIKWIKCVRPVLEQAVCIRRLEKEQTNKLDGETSYRQNCPPWTDFAQKGQ